MPQVDPEDLKTCWQLSHEHPEKQAAIGMCLLEAVCKPGADVQAVSYRAMLLALVLMPLAEGHPSIGGEKLVPWVKDGFLDDAVFGAAAQTPMEWMGVGIVRQGLPFNLDEFMRRVREHQEGGVHEP